MLRGLVERSLPLPGAPGVRGLEASRDGWPELARDVAAAGGRLLAFWTEPGPADRKSVV